MQKFLFLALASIFTCCFSCAEPLSAGGSVKITGLNNANIVETVIKPPVVTPVPVKAPSAGAVIAPAPVATPTPIATPTKVRVATPVNGISLGGDAIPITNVSSTTQDSGSGINRIGKLLYGHNSASVFGSLKNLTVGSTFTVTENNITTTYQVAKITTYEKSADGRLQLNNSGSYMKAIRDRALGHDIALMTCAGTPYGNGNASHRLVIFANEI